MLTLKNNKLEKINFNQVMNSNNEVNKEHLFISDINDEYYILIDSLFGNVDLIEKKM